MQNCNLKDIFTENFPDVKTNRELFSIFNKNPKIDKYYITTSAIPERRKKISSIFNDFREYASRHFLTELRKDFHARTWEMYLSVILLKNNLKIKVSRKDKWPDIIIDNIANIECVTCQNAQDPTKPDFVPQLRIGIVSDVPRDQILLRISNSISSKYQKYMKSYKKDNSKLPFIIAINSGIFGLHQNGIFPIILDYTNGVDNIVVNFERKGLDVRSTGLTITTRDSIQKGLSTIDSNIFGNDKYKEISAIIFSSNLIINTPDLLGSDLLLIKNKFAENPLGNDLDFIQQPKNKRYKIRFM